MSHHTPDRAKIPKSLQALAWEEVKPDREYTDGNKYLTAVPFIRDADLYRKNSKAWEYDFQVVTVRCDEGYFRIEVNDDLSEVEIDEVDFLVEIG